MLSRSFLWRVFGILWGIGLRLQVRRHRTPSRRVSTREDVIRSVEPLLADGTLKELGQNGIDLGQTRSVIIACGDADRFPELLGFHQNTTNNVYHHVIAVNGGAFLMYRFWTRWALFAQIIWAIRLKELEMIALYVHWPCGAAMNIHNLELREVIRRLQWVRQWLEKALTVMAQGKLAMIKEPPQVVALVHVDRCCHSHETNGKVMTTYLVEGSPTPRKLGDIIKLRKAVNR
ncbi:MAG: hypothetical protein K8Q91_01125 [Candidatus Vogelbacteria bacterium]|nr:hypothetical protein [Candidatus Vogelbacteria bacterium]